MAELAFDPPEDVSDATHGARSVSEPPAILKEPFDAPERQAPVRSSPQLAELHSRWADLSKAGSSPPGRGLRQRLARMAGASSGPEHELLGALIRASDAVAAHNDELADRLSAVERRLEELMTVMSEELIQIKASLASRSDPPPTGPGTADPSAH